MNLLTDKLISNMNFKLSIGFIDEFYIIYKNSL